MRISDCAALTGTTVRTIRYYHQFGLLPVPAQRAGRRSYELAHIARILRIRWLVEAGMSLDAVAAMLDAEPEDAVSDLQATAQALHSRMAELETQLDRVQELLEMATQGRELSALPASVERIYQRLDADITDPRGRAALRRERYVAELFAQRGLFKAGPVEEYVRTLNDDDLAIIVDFYQRFAKLNDLDQAAADSEIDHLVSMSVAWIATRPELVRRMLAAMPPIFRAQRMQGPLSVLLTSMATSERQRAVIQRLIPLFALDPKDIPRLITKENL